MPSTEDVLEQCADNDVSFVRLLWVGHNGIPRGRTVKADSLESIFERGFSFQKGTQAVTVDDGYAYESQYGVADEAKIIPVPDTFRRLPYADRTAGLLCDAYTIDNQPWAGDPRTRLRQYLDDIEMTPSASFETEFYLVEESERGYRPFDDEANWSASGMQSAHDVVVPMIDALESQGMPLVAYYPEAGPGQQEIVTKHASGIRSADDFIFYRQTIGAVARNHDLEATFMPKPFADEAGSGLHIHLSMWDDGENCFNDATSDTPYGLSETAKQFIGGVLEHVDGLLALTAPNVNSYRRITPRSWSSAWACWGEGNREAVLRVPFADIEAKSDSMRIEFRGADNTVNPYLALLGLVAAGMDGVANELDPGPSARQDPSSLSTDERTDRGIFPLPANLGESLLALRNDDVLADALGDQLHQSFLTLKREQWNTFTGSDEMVTDWERQTFTRAF